MVSDARHVLPYHDSMKVAVVVPACRLKLDVLADHVEAHLLGLDDVPLKSLVGRCRIKTVRPPALVERTEVEQRLVVQGHPLVMVRSVILHYRDLAHGSIAVNTVHNLAFALDAHLDAIKIWRVRRPSLHICNLDNRLAVSHDCVCKNCLGRLLCRIAFAALKDCHFHDVTL